MISHLERGRRYTVDASLSGYLGPAKIVRIKQLPALTGAFI